MSMQEILGRKINTGAAGKLAPLPCVGGIVGEPLRKLLTLFGASLAALCLVVSAGCGGGSGANVVTVSVSPSVDTLILGTSVNLTATVSGANVTTVSWSKLQYTTTPANGKTSALTDAPTDGSFGVLSNTQATGTATYTAPDPAKFQLPDQTKFPSLQIVITATSVQNSGKSGTSTITLISGIRAVLTPVTASVPTKELQHFSIQLFNDVQNQGVKWLLTQNVVSTTNGVTNTVPTLPTCSPSCGTITPDPNGVNGATYTAPATVPTAISPAQSASTTAPSSVNIVATPVADNNAFVTGTITIVTGGPITFKGITPTIAPQGASVWDLYLNAANISSSSQIILNFQDGSTPPNTIGTKKFDSSTGQIKILFPLPATSTTTTTTSPTSTGARLRLLEQDLINSPGAQSVLVTVTDPAEPVCPPTCPTGTTPPPPSALSFTFVPVRPTSISTVPDDVVQGVNAQATPVTVDGGYFGPGGSLAKVSFQSLGNQAAVLGLNSSRPSTAKQLNTLISPTQINIGNPGLYPLYVASNATPPPAANNPSVTNMALFPDYSTTPPVISGTVTGVGLNPSAIDIDPTLRVLAVAETSSNTVEFFSISSTAPFLTSLGKVASTPGAPINVPTGISVNRTNHTVAVVNYGSQTTTTNTTNNTCQVTAYTGQSVTVLPIPGAPPPPPGTPVPVPFSVDLSGTLQSTVCPAPMPYSIGVDSDSNLALVAYSSTSVSSVVNVGFIVNLNPNSGTNPYLCPLSNAITPPTSGSGPVGQCLFAQVTLNTGTYPRVAVTPHDHLALVTPGGGPGASVILGVNVTQPSSENVILGSTLTAGTVTVTIDPSKCPPPLPNPTSTSNPCPFSMVPGNAGSVLITGVKPGNAANDTLFNGVFSASVTSGNSFTYSVSNTTASDSGTGGDVFYGGPNLIFAPSNAATTQGVAINPITSTAALADANATSGSQIDLLNALDQSVTSISFFATCTAFKPLPCPGAPELLATTEVAWQPYINALVSYNPQQKIVSVSDPVTQQRYAIVNVLGSSAVPLPVMNGTGNPLILWGGLAVDPGTNLAFVLESGSGVNQAGQIEIVNLGPSSANAPKPTHISEVVVPSPTPGPGVIGGIPNALVPQGTLTSSTDLPGVQIFGTGFGAPGNALTQVRLDGISINGTCQAGPCVTVVSDREVDVTVRASIPTSNPNSPFMPLSAPHKFALDVINDAGVQSNVSDFLVIQSVNLSGVCTSGGNPVNTQPTSVAIADQIANGPFSPIALVSVTGCNSVVVLDVNPTVNGQPNPHLGKLYGSPVTVGTSPQGIAISQPLGLAVVANNGSGTTSILDLTPLAPCAPVAGSPSPACSPVDKVPDVTVGTNPSGVATDDATGVAIVTNTGSNSVSLINLALLFPETGTPPTTLTSTLVTGILNPLAVAIDPDRGANNQGIAVVSGSQLVNGSSPQGALNVVEIGFTTPILSTTISSGFVSSTPTGVVFDPTVVTGTTNPGVFYANSSGTNSIVAFNPDGGSPGSANVGVNPTSLAINPQTGAMLTANSASNTISIVDTLSSPFKTRQTLGLPGSPTFGVAIDQFTNLAVIVDQANMRVLLFPMPN
jgi:hypothetical protein